MADSDHGDSETTTTGHDEIWRLQFETRLRDRLRTIFETGPWLTVAEISQASVGGAARLVSMTGRQPEGFVLALAGRHGVGDLDDSIQVLSLDAPTGETMMAGIRLAHDALIDLPADIQSAVDAWDPDRRARLIQPFTMAGVPVAGRPSFGGRRPEWLALEDKLAILDIWDAAGIVQAPCRVIELENAATVAAAHRQLAGPLGTVWAVDNDRGWHGGLAGTHWVPTGSKVEPLRRRLVEGHRRARVMPFLDGVPCSIHGMVIGGEVISFRPSEMLVFREPAAAKLTYGRTANYWDPPDDISADMRAAARAVGRELQQRVDFRGVFTLDGVAGSSIDGCQGFVPTEVNTRYGAALPAVLPTADGDMISLYFTSLAEVAGELRGDDHGIEPAHLERWVRDRLNEQRASRIMVVVGDGPGEDDRTASVAVSRSLDPDLGVHTDVELFVADSKPDGSVSDGAVEGDHGPLTVATARWGSSGDRGIVFVDLDNDTVPTGPVVAPQALCILRSLDRHWKLGLPDLEAASWSAAAPTATSGPGG